jgi:hypothetical protein
MIPAPSGQAHVARLFISQKRIDRWVAEEKVTLEGDRMSLPALGAAFHLTPAVHFLREVSDDGDRLKLIGRVKSEAHLRSVGGELYASSVIVGEAAYECETGFLAEVSAAGGVGTRTLSARDIDLLPQT